MDAHERIHVTLPGDLLQKARDAAGDLPLSRFIRRALEIQIDEDQGLRKTFQELSERVEALELARGKDHSEEAGR